MSYRQQLDDGSWTEWSASCVEVGDVVRIGAGGGNFHLLRTASMPIKARVASIVHKGGDPRRHPRFVPMVSVPQFPATEEGREMCRKWGRTAGAAQYEVRYGASKFLSPHWAYGMTLIGYRIRAIGSDMDYPLFVEGK
jgi:hypothetical protein